MQNSWRNCSVCKNSIQQGTKYQKCSISSCRKWAFCSVDCWDQHNVTMNHKSAWAEEETAPREKYNDGSAQERPRRRIVSSPKTPQNDLTSSNDELPKDILIVVSKLKAYIKAKADMNTSADVSEVLSKIVRRYCNDAIEQARQDGRKTVMGRDFKQY